MDFLDALRRLPGLPLALFDAYVIGLNWATIPWNVRRARAGREGHVSTVPIAGPLAATIGLSLLFWGISPHFVWVWLVDWPTALLPWMLWRLRPGGPLRDSNRERER